MRKSLIGLTAACLLLLAGCGSGSGETVQGFTQEQAQEILGR